MKENNFLHLYLPELFEWLLLNSGILKQSKLEDTLMNTAEYVESKKYFSWEQYFTDLLVQLTKDSYLEYNKKKLNPNYLQPTIKKRIIKSMKEIELRLSDS